MLAVNLRQIIRLLLFSSALGLSMAVAPGASSAQTAVPPAAGDGLSAATAYQITELGNLVWLQEQAAASQTAGKYYALMNDIDASVTATWDGGAGFLPIGTRTSAETTSFSGTFDGNGHRIVGLTINRPDTDYIGLFGSAWWGAVIKNLGLEAIVVTGDQYVGGLAGYAESSTIQNCSMNGVVTGYECVGGFLGYTEYGGPENCYASGSVRGTYAVGGAVGYCEDGDVRNCYAAGEVEGTREVGGLVGDLEYYGAVLNCYSVGAVTGSGSNVGGLAGGVDQASVSSSFWDTQTCGLAVSGGGTGKTTVEMKRQATFEGWDFSAIWGIQGGYPFLRAFPTHTLSYTAGPNGSVDGVKGLIQTVNHYAQGAAVLATGEMGYHFAYWSDGSTDNPRARLNVVADMNVTATFTNLCSLTYLAGPGGSLEGATSQTVTAGQSGTAVTAVPEAACQFMNWSDGLTANPRTDTNVMDNVRVTARFRRTYEIRTLDELQAIATGDLDGQYILMNDIDASVTATWNDAGTTTGALEGFRPIGSDKSPFTGMFDGANHRISGLAINRPATDFVGLFGCIGNGVLVSNIGLENGTVTGQTYTGGLVGYSRGGTVANCYTACPVSGSEGVGGLAGMVVSGTSITSCSATGTVSGSSAYVGGLVGLNYESSLIVSCHATGAVIGGGEVGGLAGSNCGSSTIALSYATGSVNSSGRFIAGAGGLVGGNSSQKDPGTISNSYATGPVTGSYFLGGLVGYTYKDTISVCYAAGLTGPQLSDSGGLVGVGIPGAVTNCYWDTEATGLTASLGGTGKTTVEMSQAGTFSPAGPAADEWNFSAVWGIQGAYPYLRRFPTCTLTYQAGVNGSIDGAPSESQTVNQGARTIPVTAVPVTSYHFVAWSDGSTDNPRTDTNVMANAVFTAAFSDAFNLTYLAGPGGSVVGATSQTVVLGHSGTAVTAVPDAGLRFSNWSDGSTDNPRIDANVVADINVTARFLHSYEIRTLAELQAIRTGDLQGFYSLMNDIDASDTANWNDSGTTTDTLEGFRPIGTYSSPDTTSFRGFFDGNGHKITGLTINRPDEDYVGLFGCIGSGGEVKDLGLEGGAVSGRSNVGGLVGYSASGTVTNCYTSGSVYGWAKSGSYNSGVIPGNPCSVGGLIGCNYGGAIVECHAASRVLGYAVPPFTVGGSLPWYSVGAASGYPCFVGGLVGSQAGGDVTGSSATGLVSGYAAAGFYYYSGRMFGTQLAPGSASYVGGLIGSSTGGSVAASFATGAATGVTAAFPQALVGGVAGENATSGTITDCYARGEATISGLPTASDHAGGLVADNADSGVIKRCYATGTVSGGSTGGLAASSAKSATVTGCYWDTATTSQTTSAGGTGKTTAEMNQQATFVGWDFATVWGIAAGSNNGYPYLRIPGGPPGAPNKAANPRPPDGAAAQMLDVMLGWEDGGGATSYDVFLDTANPPVTRVATAQMKTTYTPPTSLWNETTYFWRVDARNTTGTTTGDVWSFRTLGPPSPAVTPSPADGATSQSTEVTLGWQDGGAAASYDVYFGTENPPVTKVASGQTQTAYTPHASLDKATTYFWRIDAQNISGTTVGAVWSFTTGPLGDFPSRRVRSLHAEKWNAAAARVVVKDAYSFSAKMQLPAGSLAALSNATTLTLVLGDEATSGAVCVVFERPLSAATKSTLAGHQPAKKSKAPTAGGSVSFVELQPGSTKKARVVSLKWTKTGLLTVSVLGTPAPSSWDPAHPAESRVTENIADLCDVSRWPEGAATGVAVPAEVDLVGVYDAAGTVTCAGKKAVKTSDGGDLVGWSVSGK